MLLVADVFITEVMVSNDTTIEEYSTIITANAPIIYQKKCWDKIGKPKRANPVFHNESDTHSVSITSQSRVVK